MSRMFKDWLEGYMQFTEHSESPYLYRQFMGVATIAACLKRKCYTYWAGEKLYPNFFIVLVGPAGNARKGTSMAPAKHLLSEAGIRICADAITPAAMVEEMQEAKENITSDTSYEEHSSLTVFSPELTVFTGYRDQAMLAQLCDWYDGREVWKKRTRGKGDEYIVGLWLNLVGATTPDTLQKAMPIDAIEGGFTSRTIFVYAKERGKKVSPLTAPDAEQVVRTQNIAKALVSDMQSMHMLKGCFRTDADFREKFNLWYETCCEKVSMRDRKFASYIGRRATHLMKLCMVCCAARTDDMIIRVPDLEYALRLLYAAEAEMDNVFEGFGTDPQAGHSSRVLTFIREKAVANGRIYVSELLECFRNDLNVDTLGTVMGTLEARGLISTHTGATPKDHYIIYRGLKDGTSKRDVQQTAPPVSTSVKD